MARGHEDFTDEVWHPAAAAHELIGLGEHDLTHQVRRTFVGRRDLPHLGDFEVPLDVAVGRNAGAGTGPSNGGGGQIIREDPMFVAFVRLGGFRTCRIDEGPQYVRWQSWRTIPAPGYQWCGECDRTIPAGPQRGLCGECWPIWHDNYMYRGAPPPDTVAAAGQQLRIGEL